MSYRIDPENYLVGTHHIVDMIEEARELAKGCHRQGQTFEDEGELGGLATADVLERLAVRLQHAAAECLEERQSLLGWRQ